MKKNQANIKILGLFLVIVVIGGIVAFNVFFTTFFGIHLRSGVNVLEAKAGSQEQTVVLQAKRGIIKDRDGNAIAQNSDTYSIIAVLSKDRQGQYAYVEDKEFTAKSLAPILGMTEEKIMEYLNLQDTGTYQTYLGDNGKNLTLEQKKQIEAIEYTPDPEKKTPGLPGIEFEKTVSRVYTPGKFASTLLGFASYDSEAERIVGQVGTEAYLDEVLKGKDGKAISQKDAQGYSLPGTTRTLELATNGSDVYLTLDKDIQEAVEKALEDTIEGNDATVAWAIVMEVETGKILGYGGSPTYDLNQRDEVLYLDIPSAFTVEPGSTMKPFTYATAMEEGVYDGDAIVSTGRFCVGYQNGEIVRAPGPCEIQGNINDANRSGWGDITMDEGILRSSNTCIAVLLTDYLSSEVFWDYLQNKLHFFQPTGMEGVEMSEERGIMNNKTPIDRLVAGFGQGSSVTPLQMVQAYTAIFNDGFVVKPYYIDRIVDANNNVTYEGKTTYVNVDEQGNPVRVYSESTIDQITELMRGVIQSDIGTGRFYNIEGLDMMAKTGTGEIATSNGYGKSLYTTNIMAAAPASDPKIMVYYGFQSPYVSGYDRTYFKDLFLTAYEEAGIKKTETSNTETTYDNWQEYRTPALKNHTLDYVGRKLDQMDVHPIYIGDGNIVVDQYPQSSESITTKQNFFIKTNSSNITMPNMIGWTYKDVMIYKEMSGLNIVCNGSGIVTSQSVTENASITSDSEITIQLE